ncbi:MAG: prepilin-type N-terminal cleavage/methylation domain-containing protein, partial [Deltaproteobacteria bacterium]|nr:prepilin-type N-terminal cleavage/methylation domain-containing protein [Deltaproteobacteria bacterium]
MRRRDDVATSRGFTLVEVLVSLAIIAIVLITCLR